MALPRAKSLLDSFAFRRGISTLSATENKDSDEGEQEEPIEIFVKRNTYCLKGFEILWFCSI